MAILCWAAKNSLRGTLSITLRNGERAHVLNEKSIPASKIEVSWALGNGVLLGSQPPWPLLK